MKKVMALNEGKWKKFFFDREWGIKNSSVNDELSTNQKLDAKYGFLHPLALFVLTFFAHAWVSLGRSIPLFRPDEVNTLGISALLTGYDWSSLIASYPSYYGYGQAILVAPFFLLIRDNFLLYKAIVTFYGLWMTFIPVLAYHLLTKVFQRKRDLETFLWALMIGLFPCFTIYSKFAWNESLVMLLSWMTVTLILSSIAKGRRIQEALLAFLLVWGYATHGRYIAVIASALVMLWICQRFCGISLLRWKRLWVFMGGFALADHWIKKALTQRLWLAGGAGELRNTLDETLIRNLSCLTTLQGWEHFFRGINGILFNAVCVTLGVFILSALLFATKLASYTAKREKEEYSKTDVAEFFLGGFGLLAFLMSMGIGVIFFLSDYAKPDGENYIVFGRYTEYTLPFCLLYFGVAFRCQILPKPLAKWVSALASLSFALFFILENGNLTQRGIPAFSSCALLTFAPAFMLNTVEGLALVICFTAVGILILIVTLHLGARRTFCLLLSSFFLLAYALSVAYEILPIESKFSGEMREINTVLYGQEDWREANQDVYVVGIRYQQLQMPLRDFRLHQLKDIQEWKTKRSQLKEDFARDGCFIVGVAFDWSSSKEKDFYEVAIWRGMDEPSNKKSIASFDRHLWVYGDGLHQKLLRQGVKFVEEAK